MQDSTTFHQKQIQQVIDHHKTLMEEQFKWIEGMPQLIHVSAPPNLQVCVAARKAHFFVFSRLNSCRKRQVT
jgi:hypothetical protein